MLKLRVFIAVTILLVAFGASGGTFIIPEDDLLIRRASGIVSATVLESRSELTPEGGVRTVTQLWVDRVLAGNFVQGQLIDIFEPGGETPALSLLLHGVPRFTPGERVLLLLTRNGRGELTTLEFALGKFSYRRDERGAEYLLRDEGNICGWAPGFKPYQERARRADGFLLHITEVVAGRAGEPNYSEDYDQVCVPAVQPITASPEAAIDYSFCDCRWSVFGQGGSASFLTSGTQTGIADSPGAVTAGTGVWTSDGGSTIAYSRGGTTAVTQAFVSFDGINAVVFNDPSGEIDGAFTGAGTLAIGGPWFGGSHSFNGSNFGTISSADVVVQDGVSNGTGISQGEFEAILAHELGHTLGFRHSDEPGAPSQTSNALMNSSLNRASASLSSWDREAAAAMYGAGAPTCTGVSISTQPQSASIPSGTTRTLSVTVSGTANFKYQWFQGISEVTTTPVQGPTTTASTTNSFVTPVLNNTTQYWVRVQNCSDANTVNSTTATITVTCMAAITQNPQSQSIPEGNGTNLSVSVGAGTYTFQWYRGASPNTADPIAGATSSTLSTGALTVATSFWVRVTRTDCEPDSGANSNTATVSICQLPSILDEPQDQAVTSGSGASLSVNATGTNLTYQWFRGASGVTTTPVNGATSSSFFTGNLTQTSTYWVRVSNTCGGARSVNSRTVTVTVTASCTAPQISVQPQSTTINSGASATLTVTASGTTLLFQWFEGQSGDTSKPVGINSAAHNTGALTQTKSFWVRITNSCGALGSSTATVTVAAPCIVPQISAQPQSTTINSGASATLRVTASGTSLLYQWFEGQSGDTSKPVGVNSPTHITGVLTQTKRFWVLIANSCGGVGSETATITVQPACPAGTICTLNGRFELTLAVRDQRTGATGVGTPLQQNDLFGYYSLPAFTGDPTNPEVFVKVLDGRPVNGNFWTFFGGLTDLEYTLNVKDKQTGQTKSYFKQGGNSAGGFDVGGGVAPEACAGEVDGTALANQAPSVCSAGTDRLCLNSNRFRITLSARDQRTGATGAGQSIPQGDIFGYFSIPALTQNPSNPEVFVKVIDARSLGGFFWVFFSGLTDLEYTMTVTDTFTGKRKTYTKAPGSACGAFDTNAFTGQ